MVSYTVMGVSRQDREDSEEEPEKGYDGLKLYFRDLRNYPPLTREQERLLGMRILKGDEDAITELYLHNFRFPVTMCLQRKAVLTQLGIPFEVALMDYANEGLRLAAEKYDVRKQSPRGRFIHYAAWFIRRELGRCFVLERYGGRARNRNSCFDNIPSSLDEKTSTNAALRDLIPDLDDEAPDEICKTHDAVERLRYLLNNGVLTAREKRILSYRYGLDGKKERSLEAVGGIFHITRERVRQIQKKAILKLRGQFREGNLPLRLRLA